MSVEVILREYVEHLGQRGEIVKVSDGYARNYLLPRKLALSVTEESKKQIVRERVVAETRESAERQEAEALAGKLAATEIEIARRVGDHDALYGSVTPADLATALLAKQITVDKRRIQLADALKTIGEHTVPVKLHRDVVGQIRVKIVKA